MFHWWNFYFQNYRLSKTWLDHSLKSARRFRTSFDNQHVKGSQILVKYAWEDFYHFFFHSSEGQWFGKYLPYWSLKSSGCFLTHWQPMESTLFWSVSISRSLFKPNDLKNQKFFLSFLFHLWNLHQILNVFKKKIVIAQVFPKLQTVKNMVRPFSKKRAFRTSFDSQHVKGSQTLLKSAWDYFYHIFPSLSREMIWKIFPLLKFEIIGVFVNTLTADYMYPVQDFENFPFPIQMQLS